MSNKLYPLSNVSQVGSYPYTYGGSLCLPKILQSILSDKTKTLDHFHYTGTLTKTLPELLEAIEKLGARCLARKSEDFDYVYTWDHSFADIGYGKKSNSISLSGYTTDLKLLEQLKELQLSFISKNKKNMVFTIIKTSSGGLEIKNLGNGSSPLIEENYNTEVIEDVNYVVASFKKTPPVGRIAILAGEPGTGKTHLIRSILSQLDCVFMIVPSNLVDSLDRPEFMPLLLKVRDEHEKPIIIIIEDGDICLVPRKNDNISTITSLLNLSDGILGSILDIKLIISTNAAIKDMDGAIMRPGRLCKQVYVGPLCYEQANKVYQRLSNDTNAALPYSKFYTLAEVYDKFNNKDLVPPTPLPIKRAIGFVQPQEQKSENRVLNKLSR